MKGGAIIVIVLGIIAILCVGCGIGGYVLFKNSDPNPISDLVISQDKPSNTGLVTVSNAYISSMCTAEVGAGKENIVSYWINPNVALNLEGTSTKIKSLAVKNITVSHIPSGSIQRNALAYLNGSTSIPQGMPESGWTYSAIKSLPDKKVLEFKVVDTSDLLSVDHTEIASGGGFVTFYTFIGNVGKIDPTNVSENAIVESSKHMQYAKIKAGDISTTVSFTIEITFADGKKAIIPLSGDIIGTDFVEDCHAEVNPLNGSGVTY